MNQDYFKRMWYVWYPVIIKIAVSSFITIMVMIIFSSLSLVEVQSTEGLGAVMEITQDMEASQEFQEEVLRHLQTIEVPCGIAAAVITIPILGFFFVRDRRREKLKKQTAPKAALWKYSAVFVIAAVLCIGLNNLIQLSGLSELSGSYEEVMEAFYEPPFLLQIVYLAVLTPICEELTFRGLMFRRMREQTPFPHAAVFSSLVFAILHGNIVQSLYGFAMSMVFSYAYEKYGSLKAPILGHITANLISVVGTQYAWFDWMFEDILRVGMVTVICAAAGSTMFVMMQRMESALNIKQEENKNDEDNENLAG